MFTFAKNVWIYYLLESLNKFFNTIKCNLNKWISKTNNRTRLGRPIFYSPLKENKTA